MLNNEDQLSLTDESVLVTIEVNKHWNSENMGFPYSVLSFYLGEPFIEWKKTWEMFYIFTLHLV